MLAAVLAATIISAAAPPPPRVAPVVTADAAFADAITKQLVAAAPAWRKENAAAVRGSAKHGAVGVLELEIGADGAVRGLRLARSSGANDADDLLRTFLLAAEPLPAPAAELLTPSGHAICLLRLGLGRRATEAATACFAADKALPAVAGLTKIAGRDRDAGARLFAGWMTEAMGNAAAASKMYAAAVKAAPTWDFAARAYGLLLVRTKRSAEAMPYLQTYLAGRAAPADVATYTHEIRRYAKYQAALEAEKHRIRKRLDKNDLARGVKLGLELLEPCLDKARAAYRIKVGSDTLLLSWKIRRDGSCYAARLEGPDSLVMTPQGECIETGVESWHFPTFTDGDEVVVTRLPVKVRGTDHEKPKGPPPAAIAAARAKALAPGKATFSTCRRQQAEIGVYIQKRLPALNRCVQQEIKRAPTVRLPEQLPVGFVIDGDGTVRSIAVKHRFFKSGPLHNCVNGALTGTLSAVGGAACPATFDLDLRGLQPLRRR